MTATIISAALACPTTVSKSNWASVTLKASESYNNTFSVTQSGAQIIVARTDGPGNGSWALDLQFACCPPTLPRTTPSPFAPSPPAPSAAAISPIGRVSFTESGGAKGREIVTGGVGTLQVQPEAFSHASGATHRMRAMDRL
jgi:hypothetical protein